jgi:hypothetical protein
MIDFDGSLTLRSGPVRRAWLVYVGGAPAVEHPLVVDNTIDPGNVVVSTEVALPRGVYRLVLQPADPHCCCSSMEVWLPGCEPPRVPGTHTGGSQNDTGPVPSCPPAPV